MAMKHATAKAVRATGRVYGRKWSFLAAFLLIFFVSYSVLSVLDLVPESVDTHAKKELTASVSNTLPEAPELPMRIEIPAIHLSAQIANPTKTDVATLDAALLKSAVRYPGAAKLGEKGNVILFGHSSYLPIVNNPAYKIFNEIQNLEKGDTITVYGETLVYEYEVETVSQEDAKDAAIPLEVGEPTLTIATCDSFGTKSDRFVVVAKLVGSHSVGD